MRVASALAVALLAVALVAGCHKPEQAEDFLRLDYDRSLPPGQNALRKITDPRRMPDFTAALANTAVLREAIDHSLNYLAKPSSLKHYPRCGITHAEAVESLKAFRALLDAGGTPGQLNAAIRSRFDVYESVGCDMRGTVLVTCYYTPIFNGSPVRTPQFQHPLYQPPADLVKLEDGSPSKPYPDRRTIEATGMYAGNEIAWLADPFEAYVAQVQGSVKIRMPDGRLHTYGYTANNGHEYQSVRAELVKDGKVGKYAGLPEMLRYFRAHPQDVRTYTWRNPRYVFFALVEDGRPRGCLNEPVTPRRTVATDKAIFPPGCLALVTSRLPSRQGTQIAFRPWSGFALDQDSGGAIRAPGRCDLYLGVGDEAGQLAGRMKNEGRLYYLFLKRPEAPAAAAGTPARTAQGALP